MKTPSVNETTVVNGVDVLPSLLGVAGIAPRPGDAALRDGEDMSAALLGKAKPMRTKPIFWIRPPDRPHPDGQPNVHWPDLAVRDGEWKLTTMEDGSSPQLFNLITNPGEKRNVAADHPEIVERLTRLLLAWRKTMPIGPLPTTTNPANPPTGTASE